MRYKAHLTQRCEGCDYTIGCGQTTINLDSDNIEAAVKELVKIIKETYSHDEYLLKSAKLYEIKQVIDMNLDFIYEEIDKEKLLKNKEDLSEKERKEYERLKKIFEKDQC